MTLRIRSRRGLTTAFGAVAVLEGARWASPRPIAREELTKLLKAKGISARAIAQAFEEATTPHYHGVRLPSDAWKSPPPAQDIDLLSVWHVGGDVYDADVIYNSGALWMPDAFRPIRRAELERLLGRLGCKPGDIANAFAEADAEPMLRYGVERIGNLYAGWLDYGPFSWRSPGPMPADDLARELQARGLSAQAIMEEFGR